MAHPLAEPKTADDARTGLPAQPARNTPDAVNPIGGRLAAAGGNDATHGAAQRHRMAPDEPDTRIQNERDTAAMRLRPRVISQAAARATRTMCDARLAARAAALSGVTEPRVEVMDTSVADAAYADPAVIELSIALPASTATATVQVALDLQAYPALAIAVRPERTTPGANAHTPASPIAATTSAEIALRNAVAGVLLEPLLTQLERFGLHSPRVVGLQRRRLREAQREAREDLADPAPAVALSFMFDTRRFELALSADPRCYDVLDALLRAGSTAELATPDALLPQPELAIPGRLIIGMKRLRVETLNALDTGDVLLRAVFPTFDATLLATSADASPSHARPRAVAAWGTPGLTRLCAAVELDGRSLIIVKEPNMSEELDPASADAGLAIDQPEDPIRIGELELPVQFEIDTVALPLAQLSALGPGYVVELPVSAADAQLRLVAHGQTIGYGELVTVGEHLGIRIIRMAHRHGPVQ
jgi:type III secretion protein Q